VASSLGLSTASGAAVKALGLRQLRIGPTICPGVPWTAGCTADGIALAVALKSGNFGAPDFFMTAWEHLATRNSSQSAAGDQT
jgi:uncharacterized protein YgbK (DUF1537 family)